MRINITVNASNGAGSFSNITLSYIDFNGQQVSVNLNISFGALNDFSNDTSSISFDFLLVASFVYGIDNLIERERYSINGWTREIEVVFPVNNLNIWNSNREEFGRILSFLTGDTWDIGFEQQREENMFQARENRHQANIPTYNLNDYSFTTLFSGGLDSLVGVIDGLCNLEDGQKGLLLSHFDSSSPGANSDQIKITDYLSNNPDLRNKYDWIQTKVFLSTRDQNQNKVRKEVSYRSRSLLFIGIALFCTEKLNFCNVLTIPENGTISLNFPLTPSRTSTLSTRTTHPFYLNKLQLLIDNLGMSTRLENPYSDSTKGQLVENCINQEILIQTYLLSVSCGKRGRKQHWDTKVGVQQCGICMPCIYRRAALHKLNLDSQIYGIDIFTTPNNIYNKYDLPALFDFLTRNLTTEQIKRTLLVAGSIDFDNLDNSASLVEEVRDEIKNWIRDKGNNNLKQLAGVR